jgi:signal peptidase I
MEGTAVPKTREKEPALIVRLVGKFGWKPGRVMEEVLGWIETLVVAAALAAVIMTFITVRMHVPTGSMIPTIELRDSFFVDRITYYFRHPKPGDIVVFRQGEVAVRSVAPDSTAARAHVPAEGKLVFVNGKAVRTVAEVNGAVAGLADGTVIRVQTTKGAFSLGTKMTATTLESLGLVLGDAPTRYVKRLIAKGGQTVQIRDSRIYVDGVQLTGPRFARSYTATGAYGVEPTLVPEGKYFMLGDNSGDSFDSRYWGFVDEKAVIGVPYLRVWPLNRFGAM